MIIESAGPSVPVGRLCTIENRDDGSTVKAEVVGFRNDRLLLMPYGPITGITPGAIVTSTAEQFRIPVGPELIGRVVGGLGQPIDGKGPIAATGTRTINARPIPVMKRKPIDQPIRTGIKAIDLLAAVGKGQRMGIFAGSGVGKSVLLGMIARGSSADINVIGLIGERGREVREFIERDLGPEGLKRSIVVAVSSDQPALVRIKGAMVATTIAEYFRDQGKDVLLLMDSVTRLAMAQREIGLAAGEPPATKGYTPSVFAMLPGLLERAGQHRARIDHRTIHGAGRRRRFQRADLRCGRSILDGHVALSRKLAAMNQYPAVDYLDSISRVMKEVVSPDEVVLAGQVRELVATYREAEDLINIGAYVKGSNPKIDRAITKIEPINQFFRQRIGELCDYGESVNLLRAIVQG